MWRKIEGTVNRAVGSIVYSIFGGVCTGTDYNEDTKEISLIVFNKPCRFADKKRVVDKKFKYDLENAWELQAKHDIIQMIEKYLIENFS